MWKLAMVLWTLLLAYLFYAVSMATTEEETSFLSSQGADFLTLSYLVGAITVVLVYQCHRDIVEWKDHTLTFPHNAFGMRCATIGCLVLASINHLSSEHPNTFFGAFHFYQTVFYAAELVVIGAVAGSGAATISTLTAHVTRQRRPAPAA
jgi:hypothetical protein